ncbi:MAG: hypothetical protein HN936_17260 [Bacteroidetes bacterium]|nr:hypothetical protein [Bacteroidota bacterium]
MTGLLFLSEMTQPDASATFGDIFLPSNHFADSESKLFLGIDFGFIGATGSTFLTLLTTLRSKYGSVCLKIDLII